MGVVDEINRLTRSLDTAVGKYIDLSKKTKANPVAQNTKGEPIEAIDSWVLRSLLERWYASTRAELRQNRLAMTSKSRQLLNDILKTENRSDRQRLLYEYIKLHDPTSIDAAQYAKPLEPLADSNIASRTVSALPVSDLAECRSTVRAAPFFVTKKDLRDLVLRQTKLTATEATNLSRDDMCKILFARSLEDAQSKDTESKNLVQQ